MMATKPVSNWSANQLFSSLCGGRLQGVIVYSEWRAAHLKRKSLGNTVKH